VLLLRVLLLLLVLLLVLLLTHMECSLLPHTTSPAT